MHTGCFHLFFSSSVAVESLNLISDRKSAARLLTRRDISQVAAHRPAEQRGGVVLKEKTKFCWRRLLCMCRLQWKWLRKVVNLCTEGPAGTGPERYPPGRSPPEPSSVPLQITQRCPSQQSQWEDAFWSQTERHRQQEQLSLFSWSRGGRGEQGGMRNGGWVETHSCSVKPKSDRPEMLPCRPAESHNWIILLLNLQR